MNRPLRSFSRHRPSANFGLGRALRAAALLVALGLLPAACGFEPMYGESQGAAVRADLETVQVALIANRAGQLLRRYMLDRMHAGEQQPAARFELEVRLIEVKQFYGIQVDQSATYARLMMTGAFTLRDIKTRQAVLSGSATAYSSYNIAADPFNSVVAENDARERALHGLGDDLIARLSLYMHNSTAPTAAKAG